MNKLLVALGALMAGALLIPDVAEAQRGGRGGGGARVGGGRRRRWWLPGRWRQLPGWRLRWGLQDVYSAGRRGRCPGWNGEPRLPRWRRLPRDRASGRVARSRGASGRLRSPIPVAASTTATAIVVTGAMAMARLAGAIRITEGAIPIMAGATRTMGTTMAAGGAGLATGAVIGAAATYPYYNYPYSTYPYSTYQTPVASADGGYCATSVRTCALTSAAPVGTGCSCRTSGGRARGTVVAGY